MICNHCGMDVEAPVSLPERFVMIEKIVCNYFGVTVDEIKNRSRERRYVQARQCIFYFSRRYLGMTNRFLYIRYNLKDHSSVVYGTITIKNCLKFGDYISQDVQSLNYEIRKYLIKENYSITQIDREGADSIQPLHKAS